MENKKYRPLFYLLPNYFKKVGIIIAFGLPAILIILKLLDIGFIESHDNLVKNTVINSYLIGLLFIILSKDKIEDERTMILRLRTMSVTFIATILCALVMPLLNVFIPDVPQQSSQHIAGEMMFFYLLNYYVIKEMAP